MYRAGSLALMERAMLRAESTEGMRLKCGVWALAAIGQIGEAIATLLPWLAMGLFANWGFRFWRERVEGACRDMKCARLNLLAELSR